MRTRGLIAMAAAVIVAGFVGNADAWADPSQLTANELANVLGIQWWIFNVPVDAHVGDTISVHWVTPTGNGTGAGLGVDKPGEEVKIFYWVDNATHQPMVRIACPRGLTSGAVNLPDGFVIGATSGIANGTVVNSKNILVKLQKAVPQPHDYVMDGGNSLKPNEIGLKVEMEPPPQVSNR